MSDRQKRRSRAAGHGSEMTHQARSGRSDYSLQTLMVNFVDLPSDAVVVKDGRAYMNADAKLYMGAIAERVESQAGECTDARLKHLEEALIAIRERGQL